MKILYGITTNGNGHLSRGLAVLGHLRKLGAEVDVVLSGPRHVQGMDNELLAGARVFRGVTSVFRQHRMQFIATALANNFFKLVRDIRSLPVSNYDLVISDFDPVTAWAGRLSRVRTVSLCRQNCIKLTPLSTLLARCREEWGMNLWHTLANKLAHDFNAPGDLNLALGWRRDNPLILPPIVRPVEATVPQADHHLVYLPWISLEDQLSRLKSITGHPLLIYHRDIVEPSDMGNLSLRPLNREDFRRDFLSARGIIANAGFTLASESIVAGKKIMVYPVKSVMEQEINAWELSRYGYGERMTEFTAARIEAYLAQPGTNTPTDYPNVAEKFASWVMLGDWSSASAEALSEGLWSSISAY